MRHAPIRTAVALAGALLVTACTPPPAVSEPQGRTLAVDQVAGYWALTGPDGARCQVSLANLIIDGVRPVLVERCAIPIAGRGKSWRAVANGFEMLDASGAVVMTFRRTGVDAFEADAGGFILRRSPA